jgi:hypothetical protein
MIITIPNQEKSLGYHRNEMPQISQADRIEFLEYISSLYSDTPIYYQTVVNAYELKPTQGEFNNDKIIEKINTAEKYDKPIIISKDLYVLDGHHLWLAFCNDSNNMNTGIRVFVVNLNIQELFHSAKMFHKTFYKSVNESIRHVTSFKSFLSNYLHG